MVLKLYVSKKCGSSGSSMTLNVSLSHLKYILQLFSVKFSVSLTFFGTGRDRQTHGRTQTDRLFLEYVILDIYLGFENKKDLSQSTLVSQGD